MTTAIIELNNSEMTGTALYDPAISAQNAVLASQYHELRELLERSNSVLLSNTSRKARYQSALDLIKGWMEEPGNEDEKVAEELRDLLSKKISFHQPTDA